MRKIIELCVLVAILITYILFSCSQKTDITDKETELYESYQIESSETTRTDQSVEYEGI